MTPRFNVEHGRRDAAKGLPRELPVLFHLMDVSRPRRPPAAPVPAAASKTAIHIAPTPSSAPELLPPLPPLATPLKPPAVPATVSEAKASYTASTPVLHPDAASELLASLLDVADTSPASPAPLDVPVLATPVLDIAPPADGPEPDVASAADATPVHPASPAPLRRKLKTPVVEDWFTTHGRYIAICFVLALALTVYFARANRQPVPAPLASSDAKTSDAPPAIFVPPPLVTDATSRSANSAAVSPATDERAREFPSVPALTANSESKVELHPPTVPQLADRPPAAGQRPADDLFHFPQRSEEQVAARPSGPASIVNHTLETGNSPAASPLRAAADLPVTASPQVSSVPLGSAPPAPAPPAATQPTSAPTDTAPAYPVTPYPASSYPPISAPPGPPVSMQPVTNFGSAAGGSPGAAYTPQAGYSAQSVQGQYTIAPPQYQAPPAGTLSQTIWPPVPPVGSQQPLHPSPDSSARGFRYERTGSGLY